MSYFWLFLFLLQFTVIPKSLINGVIRRTGCHNTTRPGITIDARQAIRHRTEESRYHGAHGILCRPTTRHTGQLFADTDMDAEVQEVGLAVRRRVGSHSRAHADASVNSVRVASRTWPTRKCCTVVYKYPHHPLFVFNNMIIRNKIFKIFKCT